MMPYCVTNSHRLPGRFNDIALARGLKILFGYVFDTEKNRLEPGLGHLAHHVFIPGHGDAIALGDKIQVPEFSGDDGITERHDAVRLQHEVVVGHKYPAGFALEVDIFDVGQDPLLGKGAERPAVHVIHAAEVAGTGAAPGGLDHFYFAIHDMISPGQPPLVSNGQLELGQIEKFSPGVVNKSSAVS